MDRLIEVRYYKHYAAPAAAALFIVTVPSFRHLRQWKPGGQPAGRFLARALPVLVVGAALAAQGRAILGPQAPTTRNAHRDEALSLLNDFVEKHVILVRYTGRQSPPRGMGLQQREYRRAGCDLGSRPRRRGERPPARIIQRSQNLLFQPDLNFTWLDPYGDNP